MKIVSVMTSFRFLVVVVLGAILLSVVTTTITVVDGFTIGQQSRCRHLQHAASLASSSSRLQMTTPLASGREAEKEMRRELMEEGISETADLAVMDGANMERAYTIVEDGNVTTATTTTTTPLQQNANDTTASTIHDETTSSSLLQATMDRMTQKPRAYPLFLAEKCVEIAESTIGSLFQPTTTTTTMDNTDEETTNNKNINNNNKKKEHIVVLGTGWGAATFLKQIDTTLYDVTVVSPRNYFLFTPMLAGSSVGTVEFQSITEPVRSLNRHANYLEAVATQIDPTSRTVECESVVCEGNSCQIDSFELSYDRLLVTVGAQTNTFGIPGVKENCCFLKQVSDARRIRTALVNCFERANLPHLSTAEKRQALTFCVIGAGPTGVEFAAELRDFIEEDGPKYYPELLPYVQIQVIEAASTVLAPFDQQLQQEAIRQMKRTVHFRNDPFSDASNLLPDDFELVQVRLGCSVKEVTADTIYLNDGQEIKYGLSVWAAGNGPLPLTLQTIDVLGKEQKQEQDVARGRLAVDPWLRVVGGEGRILSLGDCSCITSGQLPATAQVALQQGEYLASLLNHEYILSPPRVVVASDDNDNNNNNLFPPPQKHPDRSLSLSESIAAFAIQTSEYARPFQFWNLGILAYTGGGSALAQVAVAPQSQVKSSGKVGNTIWKGVYLSKQVSWRNRLLVLNDWFRRQVFGRDITRI